MKEKFRIFVERQESALVYESKHRDFFNGIIYLLHHSVLLCSIVLMTVLMYFLRDFRDVNIIYVTTLLFIPIFHWFSVYRIYQIPENFRLFLLIKRMSHSYFLLGISTLLLQDIYHNILPAIIIFNSFLIFLLVTYFIIGEVFAGGFWVSRTVLYQSVIVFFIFASGVNVIHVSNEFIEMVLIISTILGMVILSGIIRITKNMIVAMSIVFFVCLTISIAFGNYTDEERFLMSNDFQYEKVMVPDNAVQVVDFNDITYFVTEGEVILQQNNKVIGEIPFYGQQRNLIGFTKSHTLELYIYQDQLWLHEMIYFSGIENGYSSIYRIDGVEKELVFETYVSQAHNNLPLLYDNKYYYTVQYNVYEIDMDTKEERQVPYYEDLSIIVKDTYLEAYINPKYNSSGVLSSLYHSDKSGHNVYLEYEPDANDSLTTYSYFDSKYVAIFEQQALQNKSYLLNKENGETINIPYHRNIDQVISLGEDEFVIFDKLEYYLYQENNLVSTGSLARLNVLFSNTNQVYVNEYILTFHNHNDISGYERIPKMFDELFLYFAVLSLGVIAFTSYPKYKKQHFYE